MESFAFWMGIAPDLNLIPDSGLVIQPVLIWSPEYGGWNAFITNCCWDINISHFPFTSENKATEWRPVDTGDILRMSISMISPADPRNPFANTNWVTWRCLIERSKAVTRYPEPMNPRHDIPGKHSVFYADASSESLDYALSYQPLVELYTTATPFTKQYASLKNIVLEMECVSCSDEKNCSHWPRTAPQLEQLPSGRNWAMFYNVSVMLEDGPLQLAFEDGYYHPPKQGNKKVYNFSCITDNFSTESKVYFEWDG